MYSYILDLRNPRNKFKMYSVTKIVLHFFSKFSAFFYHEFRKFFMITWLNISFSHSRSEQFSEQNTISIDKPITVATLGIICHDYEVN